MGQTQTNNRIYTTVHDIFHSPESLFKNYFIDKKIPLKTALKVHIQLWVFAPLAKIVYNILGKLASLVSGNATSGIFKGVLTSIIVYPVILLLVYQMDKIRYYYQSRMDREKKNPNPQLLFTIGFLPFSTSSIFWVFPAPLNFFLIMISLGYSLFLSWRIMTEVCRMKKEKIFEISLVSLVFLMALGLALTLPLNIIRTVIN